MGQTNSIKFNGILIEKLPKAQFNDEIINQQLIGSIRILEDFINYYKYHQKIHLKILEKLLSSICIEEECLKRLKITLDEEKNEFFYNENLFIYNTVQQMVGQYQKKKKQKRQYSNLEELFTEVMLIFKFKREMFFTYPFYFFCEFLKFATIHLILMHFISNNKSELKSLFTKYFSIGYNILLDGMLSRITMISSPKQDIYSNYSHQLRNCHDIKVFAFKDDFKKSSYVTQLQDNSRQEEENNQNDVLTNFRHDYINAILIQYGNSRAIKLQNIFNLLSESIGLGKPDLKETKQELRSEIQEYENQIHVTIPQFLQSLQEVIYMKNTQKSEIHDMNNAVTLKNLEQMFSKLEKLQKEFSSMEPNSNSNNLNNNNDTQDDTLSKVSHIFSNKHINIYQHYNKQLIMQDQFGFKIRVNQSLEVLNEQIQECEDTIETNKLYKKQYKQLLNQTIHKIKILNFIENNCLTKKSKNANKY